MNSMSAMANSLSSPTGGGDQHLHRRPRIINLSADIRDILLRRGPSTAAQIKAELGGHLRPGQLVGSIMAHDVRVGRITVDRTSPARAVYTLSKAPPMTAATKRMIERLSGLGYVVVRAHEVCTYPSCRCPVDARPGWCAKEFIVVTKP